MADVTLQVVREGVAGEAGPAPAGEPFAAVVDTETSVVLLMGGLAYKTKKPVLAARVDLRTREARLAALRAELDANRAAPGVYLGLSELLPMYLPGAVGEPVLVMRRLPQVHGAATLR